MQLLNHQYGICKRDARGKALFISWLALHHFHQSPHCVWCGRREYYNESLEKKIPETKANIEIADCAILTVISVVSLYVAKSQLVKLYDTYPKCTVCTPSSDCKHKSIILGQRHVQWKSMLSWVDVFTITGCWISIQRSVQCHWYTQNINDLHAVYKPREKLCTRNPVGFESYRKTPVTLRAEGEAEQGYHMSAGSGDTHARTVMLMPPRFSTILTRR